MAVEPMSPNIPQGDAWRNADAEPKRRRMRKRKRRPQIEQPDLLTQERHISSNIESRNTEFSVDPPEPVKRRRKHNRKATWDNAKGWGDESDVERPARRRGHRRKRPPTVDTWPRLSEFDHFRPSEIIPEESAWNKEIEPIENENVWNKDNNPIDDEDDLNIQQEKEEDIEEKAEDTPDIPIDEVPEKSPPERNVEIPQHDKSLSEFSLESLIKSTEDGLSFANIKNRHEQSERNKALIKIAQNRFNLKYKRKKEAQRLAKTMDKMIPLCKKIPLEEYRRHRPLYIEEEFKTNNEPLEPLTLKAILKRSNGKSLSEILQQNNLSLSDLLQGRVNALSLLKSQEENGENTNQVGDFEGVTKNKDEHDSTILDSESNHNNEYKKPDDPPPIVITTTETSYVTESKTTIEDLNVSTLNDTSEDITTTPKTYVRRRFPFNLRRKFRTRPVNGTYKGQLSRDMMALTTRKYRNRNIHRSREWVEYMPSNTKSRNPITAENKQNSDNEDTESSVLITTISVEETTQPSDAVNLQTSSSDLEISVSNTQNKVTESPDSEEFSTTLIEDDAPTTVPVTEKIVTITQKPKIITHIRSILNASELRRQALNNRLQKKRLREKNSSTESNDLLQKVNFDANNMQTSSEFIAKTQPSTSNTDTDSDFTTLEDFMPTESVTRLNNRIKTTKSKNLRSSILPKIQPYLTATEETAKFEIEEILNDSMTRARLSRILKERNMTLNELVEHRERGSSHVHLADIFHNASKEPNPPEPFLSKSLIEPMSKETYPLRALLEANLHDPKTTIEEMEENSNYMNIPVVMDFGNNVNENGENMGIMSLFNKNTSISDTDANEKADNSNYIDVTPVIDTKDDLKYTREGRGLGSEKGLVNWNELFKLLQNQSQAQEMLQPRMSTKSETLQKILLEDDDEGDAVVVFEELDKLKDNDAAVSKEEQYRLLNNIDETHAHPVYSSISNTRSVTVVTASVIGLALVLFLLTYAAFKWKQQSKIIENKPCNNDDRLPSPIFENQKGIRSSTRSKSPMLTSNIYSINTLDTHAGTESPEYMWDSLRKPFQ